MYVYIYIICTYMYNMYIYVYIYHILCMYVCIYIYIYHVNYNSANGSLESPRLSVLAHLVAPPAPCHGEAGSVSARHAGASPLGPHRFNHGDLTRHVFFYVD